MDFNFGLPERLESEKVEGGYTLYFRDGSIVGVKSAGGTFLFVGTVVTSTGGRTYLPAAGTKGVVFHISRPFEAGRSNDILAVRWEDGSVNMSLKGKEMDEVDAPIL